eukprot:CAMPEP_0179020376 /NCGR_PEP_ID=MMETSP0796-20121207/5347_1 /TAXON_ID=73915 /ORGANISM="Pyrodinium bahamense, Strain pbaha01" /LENGTH=377 /DNA_ID=CAMNT_0020716183 /DNA_START=29 /DNA_END=1159 /DNA_ORIENTATION=-
MEWRQLGELRQANPEPISASPLQRSAAYSGTGRDPLLGVPINAKNQTVSWPISSTIQQLKRNYSPMERSTPPLVAVSSGNFSAFRQAILQPTVQWVTTRPQQAQRTFVVCPASRNTPLGSRTPLGSHTPAPVSTGGSATLSVPPEMHHCGSNSSLLGSSRSLGSVSTAMPGSTHVAVVTPTAPTLPPTPVVACRRLDEDKVVTPAAPTLPPTPVVTCRRRDEDEASAAGSQLAILQFESEHSEYCFSGEEQGSTNTSTETVRDILVDLKDQCTAALQKVEGLPKIQRTVETQTEDLERAYSSQELLARPKHILLIVFFAAMLVLVGYGLGRRSGRHGGLPGAAVAPMLPTRGLALCARVGGAGGRAPLGLAEARRPP